MRRLLTVLAFALLSGCVVPPARAAVRQLLSRRLRAASRRLALALRRPQRRRARQQPERSSIFDIDDFNSVTVGGEWLVALGDTRKRGWARLLLRTGADSIYRDLVNEDQTEIEQELKLRIVPFTATFRFLPLGRDPPSSRTSAPASAVLVALHARPASSSISTRRSSARPTSATEAPPGRSSSAASGSRSARGISAARSAIRRPKASCRRTRGSRATRSISAGSTISSTFNIRF